MAIKNLGLEGLAYAIVTTEAAAAETAGEVVLGTGNPAEALAVTEGWAEMGDFIYSATAEGRTGEVADGATAIDVDDEPGLIYTGPSGVAFTLKFKDIDVAEGTIAPEAADSCVIAAVVNNTILAFSDEGYSAPEEAAVEHNLESGTYAVLTEGDVVRLAVIGDGAELDDWDLDVAGSLMVIG